MDTIDQNTVDRVWQRVRGNPAPQPCSIKTLIYHKSQDIAVYRYLAGKFTGSSRALLEQLAQQEQAQVACLKGIYKMDTGSQPDMQIPRPKAEPTDALLRRCYGRKLQNLACFTERSGESQFGVVFARLAAQEQQHCQDLMILLGSI